MAYDARQGLYLPQFGNAVLGGIEKGQGIRKGILDEYLTRKKDTQETTAQALGQQYAAATGEQKTMLGQQLMGASPEHYGKILGNEKLLQENKQAVDTQQKEYMARAAFDVLNAPKNMQAQVYSDYLKKGVESGALPQEYLNDTLDDNDLEAMQQMVRGGQKISDFTTTKQQDREFGLRERELAAARAERIAAREEAAQARKDALDAARNKPMSPEAELEADFKAGRISEDVYKRSIAKKMAPTEKTYKQFQLQAASFADRMAKAEGLLLPFEENGTDLINNSASAASKVPFAGNYLENKFLTSEQQIYRNAASEWIRAKLRKESGAAIGNEEMDKEYRTYFPVPGDGAKVIKQKAELRKNNTASMIKQASGAYEEQYLGEAPGETSSAPANSPAPGTVLIYDAQGNLVK